MRGGGVIRRHIVCDVGVGGVIRRHIACDAGGGVIRRLMWGLHSTDVCV